MVTDTPFFSISRKYGLLYFLFKHRLYGTILLHYHIRSKND